MVCSTAAMGNEKLYFEVGLQAMVSENMGLVHTARVESNCIQAQGSRFGDLSPVAAFSTSPTSFPYLESPQTLWSNLSWTCSYCSGREALGTSPRGCDESQWFCRICELTHHSYNPHSAPGGCCLC